MTNTVNCCGEERTTKFCPECGSKLETPEAQLLAYLTKRRDTVKNETRESGVDTKPERLRVADLHLATFNALVAQRDALLAEREIDLEAEAEGDGSPQK